MRALFNSQTRVLLVSAAIAALPLQAAQAYEAQAFLDRLKAVMTEQGLQLDWAGFTEDGTNITLTGVKAGASGAAAELGDVRLEGISDIDGGGYRVETVTLPSYTKEDDTASVVVDGVSVTGLIVPGTAQTGPLAGLMLYDSADMETLNVSIDGAEVFAMEQLHVEMDLPDDPNATMTFSGAAEAIRADLSRAEDPQAKAVLEQLGYSQLNGYFEMEGSWAPSDGRLTLAQMDVAFDEVGTLGLTFDLGGYTQQFLNAVREMQKTMAANPDGDNSQQGLAMLGLMQQLTFEGASISFVDDSLTSRLLEFFAKQQNTTPEQLANQAKAIVPFMMGQLNDPELTAAVTQAVTKFLDDPQSLTISAKPAAGVPFSVIMAGAMSSPQALPKQLGVTVTAND